MKVENGEKPIEPGHLRFYVFNGNIEETSKQLKLFPMMENKANTT